MDAVSSPRAQLVELLWQLKQNFDQEGDSSLRFVHFNTLLNDPTYRAEIINVQSITTTARFARWA